MRALRTFCISAWMIGSGAAASAQVASFDCMKSANPTEVAICQTPSLGAKDVKLGVYYQILETVNPAFGGMAYREFRDNLRDDQARWIPQARNSCGADAGCLEQAYDKRINTLLAMIMKDLGVTYGRMCDAD
jgi:uncharacterized protein